MSELPLFVVVSLNDLDLPLDGLDAELWPMTRADKRFREFIALCHRAIGVVKRLGGRTVLLKPDEASCSGNGGAEAVFDSM